MENATNFVSQGISIKNDVSNLLKNAESALPNSD